tara:strand:- start:624 stop:1094 length:471 start_codon:yes stop_codon:yes gene_type:complete
MARKVPTKYIGSLGSSTAARRKAEIRKRATGKKKSFKALPGDARAKTRRSKSTMKVTRSGLREKILASSKKMRSGDADDKFVKAVSSVTGIPKGIIGEVYKKGQAAWAVGHRPGATQAQWAKARVYSFITKGKTTKTADKKLFERAKKSKNLKINL